MLLGNGYIIWLISSLPLKEFWVSVYSFEPPVDVREYQVLYYNILAGSACSMNRRLKRTHSLYWFHCLYTCSLSDLDSNTFNLLATWLARCICDLGLCYLAMDISFCWSAVYLWWNFECQSIHLNHQLIVREYQVLFYNICIILCS